MDEETWTIEVAPARIGATACAYSDAYWTRCLWSGVASYGLSSHVSASHIWRPTERWARRAVESMLRKALRAERRAQERDDAARVYLFQG